MTCLALPFAAFAGLAAVAIIRHHSPIIRPSFAVFATMPNTVPTLIAPLASVLLFGWIAAVVVADDEPRVWTAVSGQTVEAKFIELSDDYVRLQLANGAIVRVPLNKLVREDQQAAMEFAQQAILSLAISKSPYQPDTWRRPILTSVPPNQKLNKFYQLYMEYNGVPIVASKNVDSRALSAAHYWMQLMMAKRPDLLRELALANVRVSIVGADQVMTDIPEYADLSPAEYWNKKTRSTSANQDLLVMSAAEENLLVREKDMYGGEQLFVHELAHTVHQIALARIDPAFDGRLEQAYSSAMEKGLWQRTHSATTYREYFAEGVQIWFNVNGVSKTPNGIHGPVATRDALKTYDPKLAALIESVFP